MKRFVKFLLLVVTFATFSSALFAQNKKQCQSREQMAEAQVKQIAHELALDDATTARFSKLYLDYQREVWALNPRDKKQQPKKEKTEAEMGEAMKARFARSQKMLDLRQKYYGLYSEFLTQKQIARVYQLERQNMQRLAKQRAGRPGGRPEGRMPRKDK